MGIFDIFTGAPMKKAAEQQRQYLQQQQNLGREDINAALTRGTGYVQTGANLGRDALSTGYNTATGAINTNADQAINYLDEGTLSAIGQLRGDTLGSLNAMGQKYGAATDMYLAALGVNGPDAQNEARTAFTASPGYQFNLDQGLEAINRRRNAMGMAYSGNADRDAQIFGAGLASQEYDKWLNNFGQFINPEMSAANLATGVNTNIANLMNTAGTNKANVASSRGGMLADLASRYGQNVANLETTTGGTLAGLEQNAAGQKVGLNTALSPAYAKTYSDAAAAQMAGSGNLWNLGLQAAKLAVGGLPGLGSFGVAGGGGMG